MRFSLSLTLVCLACLGASRADAATDTACWNRDLERLDYYQDPPEDGDSNFFTGVSNQDSNTNVVLIYDAKASMTGFTQKMYRIKNDLGGASPLGCNNDYLNSLKYFMPTSITPPAGAAGLQGTYLATNTYPDPSGYSGGSGLSDGLTTAKAYRYKNWPAPSGGTPETSATACSNAVNAYLAAGAANTAAQLDCTTCLSTKGYWLNTAAPAADVSTNASVFTTNWLRFHPVKWVLLNLAYKRLVNGPLLAVLREAVVASNGTTGGQVLQKMLPQSCNGQGRPMNQKLGAIDGLAYNSTANPLAEMLFNTAWYMGGQPSSWGIFTASAAAPGSAMGNGKSDPCGSCSGDFAVIFSDGRGDTANPGCTAVAGVTPAWCSAAAACSTLGMGAEDDGNDYLDPSVAGGAGTLISGTSVRQTPGGTCDMDFADDVAYWMANNKVSNVTNAGTVKTFVVAIGDPNNTYGEMTSLQAIAAAGGGQYVVADSFEALEANIEQVMTAIITRATSFSAAAITTVQTSGYTSAFIPRFVPASGAQWQGTLTRYNLFNEFAAGCTVSDYNTKDTSNPNGNNSCTDVYLADKNSNFIGEDSTGQFVQLDTTKPWDAGWPLKTTADGGTIPSAPFWEASAVLTTRENAAISGDSSKERRIFTVAPLAAGSYDSSLVDFTVANVSNITPLLQLGGVNGDYCTTLALQTRHTYATENDCATDVIKFIHGRDVLLQNAYNRTNPQPAVLHARPKILGDVFHSTPVLVTPPVPTYLCDLGISNQCVPSLYSPTLEANGQAAYQTWSTANQYRTEFVLLGSNDGMVHAFNAGTDQVVGGVHSYDLGTGDEMWAFIPPDMLPKLVRYMIGERHELLVDGTPMVRDIWVDGSGASSADHQKQSDEYHTVAIVGEREGGRGYVALDVTDPTNPAFRWSWPPPGTTAALTAGESWADLGPSAPPIGPIAEADTAGTLTVGGVKAKERYVVALGGGHDPAFLRGRAIYMLDAWTGSQVYRYASSDSTGATDPRNKLMPVAAPVVMLDTDADGLFDVGVVGDTGGQVWTLGLGPPGADTDGDGRYDNWFAGRAFIEFKGQAFYKRNPFYQRVVAAALPGGGIRIFIGAGDRAQIKDPNGGTCGLANLNACMRKNCAVTVQSTRYRVGTAGGSATSGHYESGSWTLSANGTEPTASLSQDSLGSDMACSDVDDSQLDYSITCGALGTTSYTAPVYCDWSSGVDGGTECLPDDTGRPLGTSIAYTPAITMQNSRFYAFKLFDTSTRVPFTTAAGAVTYDTNALTDTDLVNADVTTTSTATSNGWYVVHAHSIDEMSASSALLIGGCVIWKTLQPNPVQTLACGGTLPLDTAYTYQGDATSGTVSCGETNAATYTATSRSISRNTYVAPQQPALVISVNAKTGQVAYGSVSLEPGAPPTSTTVGTNDLMGTIHWLEVPREVHECRHLGTNCQ